MKGWSNAGNTETMVQREQAVENMKCRQVPSSPASDPGSLVRTTWQIKAGAGKPDTRNLNEGREEIGSIHVLGTY